MKKKSISQSASFDARVLVGVAIFFAGVHLTLLATANPQPLVRERVRQLTPQVDGVGSLPSALFSGVRAAWVAGYNGPGNGDDVAAAIAVDRSGNVYVTGFSLSCGGDYDYATIKYDSAGQEQWVARYNGPGNDSDEAYAIAVDESGNVYVTGWSMGAASSFDYATIKYDSTGHQQWVARYNGPANDVDYGVAIALDTSGNVYVTGVSRGLYTLNDYATIKYNSSGEEQWVARYDYVGGIDNASAIVLDNSRNVYVTGFSGFDYATIKYDSTGQEQWVARYNGPGNDADGATAIATDYSGNVYVTGFSVGSGTAYDYATIKYNSAGQEQWIARYNGPGNDWDLAGAVAVDRSGNVYVTGSSVGTTYPDYDYATIKYNSDGQQQWIARYNGPGNGKDHPSGLAIDGSGNVYVTGSSDRNSVNSFSDYVTIKYNSAGQELRLARYNGPANSYDIPRAIAVDRSGNVYVTGNSFGPGTQSDYATIRYMSRPATTPTPTPAGSPR